MADHDESWIEVVVDGDGGPTRTGFQGRWLTVPDADNWSRLPGQPMSRCYGLAAADDGVYVYSYHLTEDSPRRLDHYPSMAAALAAGVAADIVAYAVGTEAGHLAGRRPERPPDLDAARRAAITAARGDLCAWFSRQQPAGSCERARSPRRQQRAAVQA